MIGGPQVVAVDQRDPPAMRFRGAAVTVRPRTGIGLAHQANRPADQVADRVGAAVARAIVDDDYLGRGKRLRQDRLESGADVGRLVEQRDDDRDTLLLSFAPVFRAFSRG